MVLRLLPVFFGVSSSLATSPTKRAIFSLLTRLGVMFSMSISWSIIPDFVAKDSSLLDFDLRLTTDASSQPPFYLPESICAGINAFPIIRTENTAHGDWRYAFWSFLLTPHTRWDSARFLRVAHNPLIRYPNQRLLAQTPSPSDIAKGTMFIKESEEAHPFLPLFPFMIQMTAALLSWSLPPYLLPPTCEGLLTFAAILFNTTCCVIATLALYQVTYLYLSTSGFDNSRDWASRTAFLFIFNPASVFLGSSYSEAFGSALTFTACLLLALHRMGHPSAWYGSLCLLYLCCWVRSNSSIYAGFHLLHGLGLALCRNKSWAHRVFAVPTSIVVAVSLLLGALGLHNYFAVRSHCAVEEFDGELNQMCPSDECQPPSWCENGPWFNLYSYVQAKYWNVGPFNYYELKQLPNFLLATPVLVLSGAAVCQWISNSWAEQVETHRSQQARSRLSLFSLQFWHWCVASLRCFAGEPSVRLRTPHVFLTASPLLLGHYAVLFATLCLMVSFAHIQIATRVIFSSCPAIYWYLTAVVSKNGVLGEWVLRYFLLYHVLGVIMHPNWLPWT